MDHSSRRAFLALGVTGFAAGLAGCSSRADEGTRPSATTATTDAERRDRVAELEAELATLRGRLAEKDDRIDNLEAELEGLRAQRSGTDDGSASATAGGFSEEVLDRARPVAKRVRSAVVTISGEDGGSGTAWFLEGGLLLTNSHVVDGQSAFECWTVDGESFEPTLLGASEYLEQPYEDVAVLETAFDPPAELSLGRSSSLTPDQPVVQVGHPGMVGNWAASIGRYVKDGYSDTVLTTVPSQQGNSGGPLVTLEGDVVGILSGEVRRDRSDGGRVPEPLDFQLYEAFPESTYSSHDTTAIVRKYVERFG